MGRIFLTIFLASFASVAEGQSTESISLRGKPQLLHLYGPRTGDPIVLSSGDGGWIHLGPQLALILSAEGYFVVGFDSRAYLESFTSNTSTLDRRDEPGDFANLIAVASKPTGKRPILMGVSEGAGLSLLAACDGRVKPLIAGVIGVGLGILNELGWRWRDSVIYVTHGVPHEPLFSAAEIAGQMSPAPLALINSTHDEYVPASDVERIMAAAAEPKKLWMVDAADHRFSNNAIELTNRVREAIAFVRAHQGNQ